MILFLFILGLFTGSFLGVLADRIPFNKPFLSGRSYCDSCKKELAWYDLIPVLSYVLLKGKCRYCHSKLPLFYPAIEIATGIVFALTYIFINFQFSIFNEILNFIFYLFIVSVLIVIFFTDLKYGVIADKILFSATIITFLWLLLIHNSEFIIHLLSAVGSFLFLFLIPYIYYLFTKKEAMGGGDIKFAFLMGLLLGFPAVIVSFYSAFLTGAFISIILILWGKKSLKGGTIAFGPFLVFGTFLGLFLGDEIINLLSALPF